MRSSVVLVLLAGCATAAPQPTREQACQGTDINVDRVAAICTAPLAKAPPPMPATLDATLRPTPLRMLVGDTLPARVRFTNTSPDPLDFDLALGCPAFVARIFRDDGTAADRRDGDAGPLPCTPSGAVHLKLDPGGWAEKDFSIAASRLAADCSGQPKGPCTVATVGPMDPGTYRLQVTLPFQDSTGDKSGETALRTVETSIVVSARED